MKYFKKAAVIVSLIAVLLTGCSQNKDAQKKDIDKFVIAAEGKEIIVNVSDLISNFDPVNTDVISINSSGEENKMNVTGVPLKTVLKSKGIDLASYNSVRPVSGDGYSIEIPEEILAKREVLLAYKIDNELLNEKSRPLRIIVHDERAMFWARNVVKIELLKKKAAVATGKLIFLETAYKNLEQTKYMYQDSYDPAVKISDLLSVYGSQSGNELYFVSKDGLKRTETRENALLSLIKISGKASPLFLSPDLPGGMFIKEILSFKQDSVCFFSLKSFQNTTEDSYESIPLNEIVKNSELTESESYLMTSLDGSKITIKKNELENAKISYDKGIYSIKLSDGVKQVNDILSLEKAE